MSDNLKKKRRRSESAASIKDEEEYSSITPSPTPAADLDRPNLVLDIDELEKSPREFRFSLGGGARKPSTEKSLSSPRKLDSSSRSRSKPPPTTLTTKKASRRPESEQSVIATDIEVFSDRVAVDAKPKRRERPSSVSEKSRKSRTYQVLEESYLNISLN